MIYTIKMGVRYSGWCGEREPRRAAAGNRQPTLTVDGFPGAHAGDGWRVRESAALIRVWWRAGVVEPNRSNVEPVRTRRRRSVLLNVLKLCLCHDMRCGLQSRAIESHSITPIAG